MIRLVDAYRCGAVLPVAVPCIGSCEASGPAGLPPARHHPIFARPDTRPRAFKLSLIKSQSRLWRTQHPWLFGCCTRLPVHGGTILKCQGAGRGDWLPRSPRSESAAHGSDRSSVAFYAPATDESSARLAGVVTGKRVAARQRNATTGSERWRSLTAPSFFGRTT